jgi:UDP:flavonoid glycosyltransferase YjiC (YdhE family)
MTSAAPDARSVVLVAEADGNVGFGHLGELRAVGRVLDQRGVPVNRIAIGPRAEAGPEFEWVSGFTALAERLPSNPNRVIAWSVRTNRWKAAWSQLGSGHHVWIADVADDYPDVDALVVPTLHPQWRKAKSATRVFAGPSYFPLDVRGSREVPSVTDRQEDVLLTLGGADRTEVTPRLLPSLAGTRSTVVIGPGFRNRAEVERLAAANRVDSLFAPDGLRDLLLRHRIVITAGGNTLFEAAAAGTPALVTWEDPHEQAQGRSFAEAGAAQVIGRGVDVDPAELARAVFQLLGSSDLATMSAAGRKLIDGRGAHRISDLIIDMARGAAA